MWFRSFNLFVILQIIFFSSLNCLPIDVTGKNIKFYKLTPNEGSGNYNFNYGTKDGSQRSERGFIKKEEGSGRPLLTVTGTFKYSDEDGEVHEVSYIADEQGYRIVSKEELEELQKQLPNEIVPATPSNFSSPRFPPPSSSILSGSPSHVPPLRSSPLSSLPPTPATESQIIKLKVIKPPSDKPIACPPDKCTGTRQSKIFKIKSLKIT